jgi:hypothetical protein
MFEGMHASMPDKTGHARDVIISVRALGFGHTLHHMHIMKERYLALTLKNEL